MKTLRTVKDLYNEAVRKGDIGGELIGGRRSPAAYCQLGRLNSLRENNLLSLAFLTILLLDTDFNIKF